MDLLIESAKVKNFLKNLVKKTVKEETASCFRIYKGVIVGKPGGGVFTVRLAGQNATMDLPFSRHVHSAQIGDLVWIATVYDSFSNAFVWETINFQ